MKRPENILKPEKILSRDEESSEVMEGKERKGERPRVGEGKEGESVVSKHSIANVWGTGIVGRVKGRCNKQVRDE